MSRTTISSSSMSRPATPMTPPPSPCGRRPAHADRVRNPRGVAFGPTSGTRANGKSFLAVDGTYGRTVTVFDDGADVLTGDGGLDWFLFNAGGDNQAK